ncbi:MAG: 6-carboxytetrahydropterin synthase [Saprospiraceae bacterium]
MKIRLTKEFDFEAAHALDGYLGKCKDIHGHSYYLMVTVIGEPKSKVGISDCGMVIDFGEIKHLVRKHILSIFDHRLILRNDSRFIGIEDNNERVRYVPYQPTCENMLIEIVEILKSNISDDVQLIKVSLRETRSSYAEWYATDN